MKILAASMMLLLLRLRHVVEKSSVSAFSTTTTTTTSRAGLLGASSFAPSRRATGVTTIHSRKSPACTSSRSRHHQQHQRQPQLSMVLDRLSDECIGAIQSAHTLGNDIGLTVLRNEILFAGVVAKPERAASTLQKYSITYERVKESAMRQIEKTGVDLIDIRDGTPGSNTDPLPFSAASKLLLEKALGIAEQRFGSDLVRSEHVLLALLGYNYGKPIESAPALDVLATIPNLKALDGKGSFSCFKFCEQLVQDLESTASTDSSGGDGAKEEVRIGGSGLGLGTATLSSVGVDLTQMALDGLLDNVYGRDDEIRSALRTLGRRRKNNPCLIGEPGVGKTAVAEAIAQVLASAIAEGQEEQKFKFPIRNPFDNKDDEDEEEEEARPEIAYTLPSCPDALAGARLISIELASLVAGTRNRGDFEAKVQSLIKEAQNNNVILFIDEIHNLIGTGGGGDGAMNAANLLKPALARGELRILGATTTPEYRRYIEKDGALERRFQPLEIKEPSVDETIEILATIMPRYEEFHGVEYTSNALIAAAKLSDRYVSDRFLPDKAIDLLDEAGSMVKMNEEENFFVTEDAVTAVISEMSGIPLGRLDTGEKTRLQDLEEEIGKRIKGQEPAVRAVAKSIRRARSGMRDGKRPVSSFLFVGPTGVGKTELCKALAETYYGQEKDMIRIDMSEYMDRFSVSRLIGAPPGYVGFEEGGQLTEAVRRKPHSVILFDELEKAHEDVLNILLQVMDEGTLTDGKGRTVNFKNTVLVMTSNIGSRGILEKSREPLRAGADAASQTEETTAFVKSELEQAMKPELLNRIDEIIVFNPLSYDNLMEISNNMLDAITKRAADDQNIRVSVANNIAEIVTRTGFAAEFGARPIRRAAKRYLEDTLAEAIIRDFIQEGDQVSVDLVRDLDAVKITNLSANGSGDNTLIVPVDGDAGIGAQSAQQWQRLNGPAPSLDDDEEALPQEPDGFQ